MRSLAIRTCLAVGVAITSVGSYAATYSPNFSDYQFAGDVFEIDSAANAFFRQNYGIELDRMYLYRDERDPFDGIGAANGFEEDQDLPSGVTGRITFADKTDFVKIDFATLDSAEYRAYSDSGMLLDSFSVEGMDSGTRTLDGGIISYITVTALFGQAAVSGLTYNYDGLTDGVNTDIPPPAPVPLPGTLLLLTGTLLAGWSAGRVKR